MSFYDTIGISPYQLLLSGTERQLFKQSLAYFRTQSLEGMYGAYEITAEGYLEKIAASPVTGPGGKTRWHSVRMIDAYGFV